MRQVAAQLDDAAERARFRGAPETAAELEQRAFELTPASDRESAGRRALIAAADHVHAGALARADNLLTALLEDAGHPALRSSAMRLLAFVRFREERYEQAIGLMHAAAAEAGDIPELRAPVELDLTMVSLAASLDHESGRPHAAAALAYAERGSDQALLSHALAVTTMADFLLGEGVDEERLGRALELEDLDEEAMVEVRPTLVAGLLAFYTGDFERARALLYPLRARLLERGQDTDLPLLSLHLAWLECSAGDLQAARTLADEGLQTAALGGSLTAHALALSALLDAYAGNVDECRQQVQEALERMGGAEFCLVVEWSSTALGLLELSLGDASAVHRTLEFLTEFFGSREVVDPIHLAFLPDEIEALIMLGELDRAQRLTELLTAVAVRFDRPWAHATSRRCSRTASGGTQRAAGCRRRDRGGARRARAPVDAARARAHVDRQGADRTARESTRRLPEKRSRARSRSVSRSAPVSGPTARAPNSHALGRGATRTSSPRPRSGSRPSPPRG